MMRLSKKLGLGWLLLLAVLLGLAGCGGEPTAKATYSLELEGTLEQSGVISYAGLDMNVYQDLQHNPCGSCGQQPVSVYVGTDAAGVVQAMAEAITRADDIWNVQEQNGNTLLLEEKALRQAEQPEAPEGPAGLTIDGKFTAAH